MADKLAPGAGSAVKAERNWTNAPVVHVSVQVSKSSKGSKRSPARRKKAARHCVDCSAVLRGRGPQTRCKKCQRKDRRARERVRQRNVRAEIPKWNTPRPCRFCDVEFQPRSRNDCRRRACYDCGLVPSRRWACTDCGAPCARQGSSCKSCMNARRQRPRCVCQSCGESFSPKSKERVSFCSRDCAYTHQHEQRVERERRIAETRGVLVERTCSECGRWYACSRWRQVCSDQCALERKRASRRRNYTPAPRVRRDCDECGTGFRAFLGPRFRFCSPRCCNRALRRNRRAAMRANGQSSPVSRSAVIRRCQDRCGLCGFPVLPDAESPWHSTLDHIVPLARGGAHTEENLQLAHFMCNVMKSDARPGWQERLALRLRTNSPFAEELVLEGVA